MLTRRIRRVGRKCRDFFISIGMLPARWRKYQISVELTNKCNCQCRFCPHSIYRQESPSGNRFDRPMGFMSRELRDLVLENTQRYASSVVLGFFGEQMLHPQFDEFVAALACERSCQLILNSNWTFATASNMKVLKLFDLVRISIDASHSDLYEQLCPGGPVLDLNGVPSKDRYGTLVKKIQYWLGLANHPETWLVHVGSSVNESDCEAFLDQWLPRVPPQDKISMKTVISYGGVMFDDRMSPNPCRIAQRNRIVVAWHGECSPCNLDVNMALSFGNLLEAGDLGRLVSSGAYRRTMRQVRRRQGTCANCFDANNHTKTRFHPGRRSACLPP